jgi:hypothetical protein
MWHEKSPPTTWTCPHSYAAKPKKHNRRCASCQCWNYHQTGSHIILETEIPSHQRISGYDEMGNGVPHPLALRYEGSILRVFRHFTRTFLSTDYTIYGDALRIC